MLKPVLCILLSSLLIANGMTMQQQQQQNSSGLNVLVVLFPWRSHSTGQTLITKELHERGYNITTLVAVKFLAAMEETLQGLDWTQDRYKLLAYGDPEFDWDAMLLRLKGMGIHEIALSLLKHVIEMCRWIVDDPRVMEQVQSTRYDLLIGDATTPCTSLLADKLGLPQIHTFTNELGWYTEHYFYGSPPPTSSIAAIGSNLPSGPDMTIFHRLQNMLHTALLDTVVFESIIHPMYRSLRRNHNLTTDLRRSHQRALLAIVTSDLAMSQPRSLPPGVKFVGCVTCNPPRPLDAGYHQLMEQAGEAGFVVVAFGTGFNVEPAGLKALGRALSGLGLLVLWKLPKYQWPEPDFPATLNSTNIVIKEWLLLNDLLGQPGCRLFVTHCGQNSMLEAAYHGVPVVAVPIMGDQDENARAMVARGMAVRADVDRLNRGDPEGVAADLAHVLGNSSYKEAARAMSRKLRAHPVPPLKQAGDWVDYALAANLAEGALWPYDAHQSWRVRYNLDIKVLSITLLVLAVWGCARCTFRASKLPTKAKVAAKSD